MPQQIDRSFSSRGYDSYTRNGVKNCGVVAKKLASMFHIPSKSHTVRFQQKNHFHAVKALDLINLTNFGV